MVVVAVTIGFFIGGGPTLLSQADDAGAGATIAASSPSSTTTIAAVETTTTTAAPPETTTTTTMPSRPPSEVSVRVYNGSTKAGQAVRVGDRLEDAGYRVLTPGASPNDPYPASVIHFVEGFQTEALAMASLLGLPPESGSPAPDPPPVKGVGPAQLVLIVADDLVLSP